MLLLVDCGGVAVRFVVGYVLVCLGWVGFGFGCLFLICCDLLWLSVVLL